MSKFSQALKDARMRNHRIFRLRGLWYQLALLDTDLATAARKAVDAQLIRMGAVSEQERYDQQRQDLLKEFGQ